MWRYFKALPILLIAGTQVFADPTDDLLNAVWGRKFVPDHGKIISKILKSNEPIQWPKLVGVVNETIDLDEPTYKEGGFIEAVILARRYDGLAALIESGVNPLAPLKLELSQKHGGGIFHTRVFHRLIEELTSDRDFTDSQIDQMLKCLMLSLKFKPSLDESKHADIREDSLITILVSSYLSMAESGEKLFPSHKMIAVKSFLFSIIKEKHRPVDRPLQSRDSGQGGKMLDFNLLTLAVEYQEIEISLMS